MKRVSARRAVAIASSALVLAGAGSAWAGEGIYAFVDESGAIHLSNQPDDARYRVLVGDLRAIETAQRGEPALAAQETLPLARPASAIPKRSRPYDDLIALTADRYGLEPALLHAVISVESGYDPHAVSPRGATGLMQLMPATALRFGVQDSFDPSENLRAGAQHLKELLARFGNLQLALAAYNAGEGAVARHGNQVPPYPETAQYVPRVLELLQRLR